MLPFAWQLRQHLALAFAFVLSGGRAQTWDGMASAATRRREETSYQQTAYSIYQSISLNICLATHMTPPPWQAHWLGRKGGGEEGGGASAARRIASIALLT